MKKFRISWTFIFLVAIGLIGVLPLINGSLSGRTILLSETARLFSLDLVHSYLNRFLYFQGLSWGSESVLVGQQGWLFTPDHDSRLRKKATNVTAKIISPEHRAIRVKKLKEYQRWLTRQGIMTLFVIVPNKQSIYVNQLPDNVKIKKFNKTDEFMDHARVLGLNVLDLRSILKNSFSLSEPTYYKTDTHWNQYGAYLGYRQTLSKLNTLYGAHINSVDKVKWQWGLRGGGDLAQRLKIDALPGPGIDREAISSFVGSQASMCLQKLSVTKLAPLGNCQMMTNQPVQVDVQPHAILNRQALNRMNVLWVRDSFGDNNSTFYQHTFFRLWEVHYDQFMKLDERKMIQKLHPDLVIYQIIERVMNTQAFLSSTRARQD